MYSDEHKMSVIININNMRNKCGLPSLNVDEQLKKDYDYLHEYQNSLVEHYNQAVKNGNMSQILTALAGGLIDCKEDDLKHLVKEYQSFVIPVNDSLEYCKNHICGGDIPDINDLFRSVYNLAIKKHGLNVKDFEIECNYRMSKLTHLPSDAEIYDDEDLKNLK